MYSKNDDTAVGGGRPPSRFKASGLRSRHLAAHALVVAWVVLALTGAGCALLVTAVAAHLVVLVRMGRGALGGRLAPIADYYRAGAAALIVGAVLGWLLATGRAGPQHYTGLKPAHVHVTLLGWIEPGLKKVDHEYVLVSSELYLGTPGSAAQVAKMRQDTPDAWVFNGIAAQYAKAPLTLKAGERARFWVVAAGPSDGVAFHIVGTFFDTVYKEGADLLKPGDSGGWQVLDLAPAQGGFVETTFPEAGHYPFVDHDMRHAEAGAMGMVEVSG
ncbi:hypothetical protein OHA79_40230 [Streptomyces sp. NBC_00841]|uniref:hypothetical protein n=1 Tax=unclassified Streptomyces TaxID=2593676 RepID=UPI00225AEE1C|nr:MULTISPECIES: hypothetical protein [unclassified Streptomyces]MCX4530759.1 hypothetical protein [Streptomyces sp. NBC_01669]WSA03495.1 hypothetical protein OHA79_40230 [Streptomyces sp. NBC_00841]